MNRGSIQFRPHHAVQVIGTILLATVCDSVAWAEKPVPKELTAFVPYRSNPVFVASGEGHWDVAIRERGWILFNDQTPQGSPAWQLWFTGYDGTREGQKKLGYATSNDGLNWTKHEKNPVYSDVWIEDMMVVRRGDVLYMFAEGRGDQPHLLTSRDGVRWERHGQLDVRTVDGNPIKAGPYGTPTAWFEDETWYLFYERRDLGVWLATSKDLKVWRNVSDDPVLSPGPDEFDLDLVALNQIVKHKGRYYAYYHGSKRGSKLWSTGVAVSDDLRKWTKSDANPLFPVRDNKSSGILVHDGKQFRLYTMHGRVDVHFPVKK